MSERICAVDGCERQTYFALEWCRPHYRQRLRSGDYVPGRIYLHQPVESAVKRYWARVDTSGGPDACWPWTGSLSSSGYGRMCIGDREVPAHRWAYETFVGPVSASEVVRHTCDNRPCQNPRHHLPGTVKENHADMHGRGRAHSTRGEANGNAKLSDQKVVEIRALYAAGGVTQQRLADRYGVALSIVCQVINRKYWAHVE